MLFAFKRDPDAIFNFTFVEQPAPHWIMPYPVQSKKMSKWPLKAFSLLNTVSYNSVDIFQVLLRKPSQIGLEPSLLSSSSLPAVSYLS
jgi:hypothetical protein